MRSSTTRLLAREPAQRGDFRQEACGGDEDMRQEVESLLAHQPQAETFIEARALEEAAKAMVENQGQSLVGRQFGPYKILSPLGVGGMGEVCICGLSAEAEWRRHCLCLF